jgi:Peroxidase
MRCAIVSKWWPLLWLWVDWVTMTVRACPHRLGRSLSASQSEPDAVSKGEHRYWHQQHPHHWVHNQTGSLLRNGRRHRQLQSASIKTRTAAIRQATNMIQTIFTNAEANGVNMRAKCVRLSFHDCVGGCDGCVDLANLANRGLDVPIDALDPVVQTVKRFLTVGDVWALCGLLACRNQDGTNVGFPMNFVGRPQCAGGATKGGPNRILPSAHFTTQQVIDYFAANFNFNPKETAAILGTRRVPHIKLVVYAACRVIL